jgi:hypothetical protein
MINLAKTSWYMYSTFFLNMGHKIETLVASVGDHEDIFQMRAVNQSASEARM